MLIFDTSPRRTDPNPWGRQGYAIIYHPPANTNIDGLLFEGRDLTPALATAMEIQPDWVLCRSHRRTTIALPGYRVQYLQIPQRPHHIIFASRQGLALNPDQLQARLAHYPAAEALIATIRTAQPPHDRLCACGCGRALSQLRAGAKYASAACRQRWHRHNLGGLLLTLLLAPRGVRAEIVVPLRVEGTKLTLTVESPEQLLVKVGQRVTVGQLLTQPSRGRIELEKERAGLLGQMASLQQQAPATPTDRTRWKQCSALARELAQTLGQGNPHTQHQEQVCQTLIPQGRPTSQPPTGQLAALETQVGLVDQQISQLGTRSPIAGAVKSITWSTSSAGLIAELKIN